MNLIAPTTEALLKHDESTVANCNEKMDNSDVDFKRPDSTINKSNAMQEQNSLSPAVTK